MKDISIFGTGYVGLVTGASLASIGHSVECFDISDERISSLESGRIPFFEPGLKELIDSSLVAGKLKFSLVKNISVLNHDVHYVAVGTPENSDGSADLSYIYEAVNTIIEFARPGAILVTKSTVPVGTNRKLADLVRKKGCHVVSNPEFLREGSAVKDSLSPDRIIVGSDSNEALEILKDVYRSFYNKCEILEMGWEDAELTKYAANAFLAAKISFMNEVSRICDAVEADIHNVKAGMVMDPRINDSFMNAGCGYGGSCFPKDVLALEHTAKVLNVDTVMLNAIDSTNDIQKEYLIKKFLKSGDFAQKRVAVLGLAFKPDTDDVREAPALDAVKLLIDEGASVTVYDPEATNNFVKAMHKAGIFEFTVAETSLAAIADVDIVMLCTEWDELVNLEKSVSEVCGLKYVLDGRNVWDREMFVKRGIIYLGVGA